MKEKKSFRSSKKQAHYVVTRKMRLGKSKAELGKDSKSYHRSIGSVVSHKSSLVRVADWMKERGYMQGLHRITEEQAKEYLGERITQVQQSTLNHDIAVINKNLEMSFKQSDFKSTYDPPIKLSEESRAYSTNEIQKIIEHQNPHNALSTKIVAETGIRAKELMSLQKIELQPISDRSSGKRVWSGNRFLGRGGISYSVIGKGGLIREVRMSKELSQELEKKCFESPEFCKDRNVESNRTYNIGYGNSWSKSFQSASERVLGYSSGGHGLRHSYAQERMNTLQNSGLSFEKSLEAVSQELGHFRPEITKVYLR